MFRALLFGPRTDSSSEKRKSEKRKFKENNDNAAIKKKHKLKGKEKVGSDQEESSPAKTTPFCDTCKEEKPRSEIFRESRCDHYVCTDCVRHHIATNMKNNIIEFPCPASNCRSWITPNMCRSLLPPEVAYRWGKAVKDSQTPPVWRFECPYMDCSARVLMDDGEDVDVEIECHRCLRLICADCKDVAHEGMNCDECKEVEPTLTLMLRLAQKRFSRRPAKHKK